jgi:hypothetical protein
MFPKEIGRRYKKSQFMFSNLLSEHPVVYEIIEIKVVEPDTELMTT